MSLISYILWLMPLGLLPWLDLISLACYNTGYIADDGRHRHDQLKSR